MRTATGRGGMVLASALVLAGCDGGTATAPDDGAETLAEGSTDVGDVEGEPGEELLPGEDTGPATTTDDQRVEVALADVDGEPVGTVVVTEAADGVFVEATIDGLGPGWRGFHLHENAACDADDPDGPFQGAGGHWAPDGVDHGEHPGDFPPLLVNETGTAYLAFQTTAFRFADLPADGVAVMVHEGPDNLGHVPDRYQADGADAPGPDQETLDTGDAGDRAACGELVPGPTMDHDAQDEEVDAEAGTEGEEEPGQDEEDDA
ncbi:superoxide dismutase family protein [Egicoccus sp. AB-alg2]|uniref:superoxide dismutase family protein n=1 Tax=Egicoccus sp. AB-alg2 TaxID=3242693 RepID=UPI00359D118A